MDSDIQFDLDTIARAAATELYSHRSNHSDPKAVIEEKFAIVARHFRPLAEELERLKPYEQAIRRRHNGYGPEARSVMPDLKEPSTPEQAMDELISEAESLGREDGSPCWAGCSPMLRLVGVCNELNDLRTANAALVAENEQLKKMA